jgi:uncharacterized protein (TIGR02186 family)
VTARRHGRPFGSLLGWRRLGRLFALAACVACLTLQAAPADAERLVTSLSNHRVQVTSNFTGDEIVLFGSIEPEQANAAPRPPYDIVITVAGPRRDERTRRKGRVFGIWMNVDSRVFVDVPSYLTVLSTRPVSSIVDAAARQRLQLGVQDTLLPQRIGVDIADVVRDDPFRVGFLRLQEDRDLYREVATGVTLLTPTLFRASIPLPSNAPIGAYEIDIKVFAACSLVARSTSAFEVIKAGFEQFIAKAAVDHGVLYGLAAVLMALMTGWLASVIFRRD